MGGLLLEKSQGKLKLRVEGDEPKSTLLRPTKKSDDYDDTDLIDYLKLVEGFQAKPYEDSGFYAIGYGHQLTQDEYKKYQKGIDEQTAEELLRQDISEAEFHAKRHWGSNGWTSLDNHRKLMAIEFAYNLGGTGLKKFPKFSAALRNGDWETMSKEHFRYDTALQDENGNPLPLKHRNETFYSRFIHEPLTRFRRARTLEADLGVR